MNEVSYSLMDVEASSIYFEPEKRLSHYNKPLTPVAVQSCPAVRSFQAQSYIVRCPYDLRLRTLHVENEIRIHVVPNSTSINTEKLKSVFTVSARSEWRDAETPVLQISTPYVFHSDKNIVLVQRHPTEFDIKRLSWRLIEGEFDIGSWVRPLSWAIEWADTSRDLWLRRGDPWFALELRDGAIEGQVKLVRKPMNDDLRGSLLANKDVSSYIKGTFSLQRSGNGL
jgi:hypothetical protein